MTGEQLIDRIVKLLRAYVVLTQEQALACALWALNTWTFEQFASVPYLEIWAMHKRSGKSTLAKLLAGLSRGGMVQATVRVLQMVRLIEATQNTMGYTPFIEEAERYYRGALGEERSIIATGYQRGSYHALTAKGPEGTTLVIKYPTYCPKAFVLIGNIHPVLRDRCISVRLDRALPERNYTAEESAVQAELDALRQEWFKTVKQGGLRTVQNAQGAKAIQVVDVPWLPSARDREIWSPLFSLATALKLDARTMETLERASVDMSQLKTLPPVRYSDIQEETVGDDGHASTAALQDLRAVIKPGETFIPSAEAVERMRALPRAQWRGFRGEGLTDQMLAVLLSRFGLEPVVGQIGKGRKDRKQSRGYKVAAINAVKL